MSENENVLKCINLMEIRILENNNLKLDSKGEKSQSKPLLEAVRKENEKMFVVNRKKCNMLLYYKIPNNSNVLGILSLLII